MEMGKLFHHYYRSAVQEVSEPAQVLPESGEKTETVDEERKNDPQLDTNAVKDQSSMSEPIRVEEKKEDKSMDQHFSQQILDMLFLQRMWRSCCFRPDSIRQSKLFRN